MSTPRHPSESSGSAQPHQAPSSPRAVLGWGAAVGVVTAATPMAFWWLPAASVHAMGLVLIAAVYVGFAVADGRRHVLVVESFVAAAFVLLAAVATTGSAWLLVAGFLGHGVKDLWQHRTGFVRGTRWWPPFCVAVDWVAGLLLAASLIAGAATL